MATAKEILRERVRERLDVLGIRGHSVSVAIGANPGYVRDLLDPAKTSMPSAERLTKLAAALQTTPEYLIGTVNNAAQPLSQVTGFRDVRLDYRGAMESSGPRIRVLGTGHCTDFEVTDDGQTVFVEQALFDPDEVVATVERPPALLGATTAYAIYFRGSSMEPVFTQGQIGIADPRRVARPGDDVIVQLNDGACHTVVTVLVKRLVRETSRYVELEQFNPRVSFRVPRERVERLHKLLSVGDLLGGG